MTTEQVEQAVREVVGQDANPRKVQALMWAVERYGLEWLKTYQQRQQSEASKARQYTSRQRSTLGLGRRGSLGEAPAANIRELGSWRLLHRLPRAHA